MSEWRKIFEKKTGIDIYLQTTEEDNYNRLWKYIEWLEKECNELTTENETLRSQNLDAIKHIKKD